MNTIEHSRLDSNHYSQCESCFEEHEDFMMELRLDSMADEAETTEDE